jgi:hypothetical protein
MEKKSEQKWFCSDLIDEYLIRYFMGELHVFKELIFYKAVAFNNHFRNSSFNN